MGSLLKFGKPMAEMLSMARSRGFSQSAVLKTSKTAEKDEAVVMTDDGRVIVCWHPEVPVPYELTKPLPVEALPTDSLLKVQALRPTKELFRPKNDKMVLDELMMITNTSKYSWLPKRRRHRYRDMDPLKEKRDREYL